MIQMTDVVEFFNKLEGPYKWYVLGFLLVLLTAVMTRVIFKTFKWFLIIVAMVIVSVAFIEYLTPWSVITKIDPNSLEEEARKEENFKSTVAPINSVEPSVVKQGREEVNQLLNF